MTTTKLDSELWQKTCETDCEKSFFYFFGDMRKQPRVLLLRRNRILPLLILLCLVCLTIFKFSDDIVFSYPSSTIHNSSLPMIFVITPTYRRPTRMADLTRMANTLTHIKNLHWIVVEDHTAKVPKVESLLNRTRLPYTYLPVKTAFGYPRRGWYQRTMALTYLRVYASQLLGSASKGVVYFGDDDNSYDVRLFDEYIRHVQKIGIWAVGIAGGAAVESFKVVDGKIVEFKVYWNPGRKFAVDMAGFAVNLDIILNTTAVFGTSCKRGLGAPETCLLEDMGLERSDLEPFGYEEEEKDRDIYVWHTKSMSPILTKKKKNSTMKLSIDTNGYYFEV